MDLYSLNIKALSKRSREFASELDKVMLPKEYDKIQTKSGDISASVCIDTGKKYLLHSKFDPKKEAERVFSSFDKMPQIIIMGGFGLGYQAEAALKLFKGIKILIVEKDISLFKLALSLRNLTHVISNPDIEFIISENGDEIIPILTELHTKNISISLHRPSYEIYPDTYKNIKKLVNSFVNSREINIATLSRFEKLWTKNILNNAYFFTKYAGVNRLFSKYENVPVFIVAAGPSLAKNFKELKKVGSKGIIIAVDTVFKRLVDEGIIPDIVMAVDPQDKITKFFEGVSSPSTLLVTEATVSKKIISNYSGNILFITSVFPMGSWLEGYSSDKGEIDIGGSVATAAYGLALKLGSSPIIFCGLDLAYPGGQTHFKGAYFEDNWLNEADKVNTAITLYKKFMNKHEFMEVPSYTDPASTVKTDRKFLMFLWWFESKFKLSPVPVIDATEGGAFKKNALIMSLKNAVSKYCTKEINKNILKYVTEENYKDKAEYLAGDMEGLIAALKNIKKLAVEALEPAEKLYLYLSDYILHKKERSKEIDTLLKTLDSFDEKIKEHKDVSNIISLAIQSTINNVMHNFDVNLSQPEKEHTELRVARQTIMLYDAIASSCDFNIHHFKRSLKRIRRELNIGVSLS
jgi:hypothetical protein